MSENKKTIGGKNQEVDFDLSPQKKLKKKQRVVRINNKEDEKVPKIPLKSYTKGGITSFLIAILAYIILFCLAGYSIYKRGHAEIFAGFGMMAVWIISLVGFAIGLKSFSEGKNKFLKFSYLGTIANAFIWIGMFLMYISYI